jgi:flagellar motor switch protein FliN/FliY
MSETTIGTAELKRPDSRDVGATERKIEAAEVSTPEFTPLKPNAPQRAGGETDIHRLNDVEVTVSVELGRTKVAIEKLLKLDEGSVFQLNRSIDSPVELVAQGVPLGNGEVVVVDGNFAVRIQQIYAND